MSIQRYDSVLVSDMYIAPKGRFVEYDDHQSELAALREELAVANHEIESRISAEVGAIEALQAAEQRNAELENNIVADRSRNWDRSLNPQAWDSDEIEFITWANRTVSHDAQGNTFGWFCDVPTKFRNKCFEAFKFGELIGKRNSALKPPESGASE